MHRDTVTQVAITKYARSSALALALSLLLTPRPIPSTNFLITSSLDGHLKFWKKQEIGIEFVKHYRTHLGPILALSASDDGKSLACLGGDTGGSAVEGGDVKGSAKVFDVENFGTRLETPQVDARARMLTIAHTRRHDKHHQASLSPASMLLGPRTQ